MATEDDEHHLRLLYIFHYVVAGITALFALFPLFHVAIGWFVLHAPVEKSDTPPPAFLGWMFIAIGGSLIVLGESFAVCVLAAGRCIQSRKGYWFVFVIACLQCCFPPFGTGLGIFTIIVLSRQSVKEMFGVGIKAAA